MTAGERLVDALDGCHVKAFRGGYRAKCPGHDGNSQNSLSVTPIEGQVLVKCFGGCDTADVLAAVGLTLRDLFDNPGDGIRYQYEDATGRPTRQVHRTPTKEFKQYGDKRTTELYRLPRVVDAVDAGMPVYLVEGEKDVHAVEAVGGVATTSPMGADNWDKVDAAPLSGAHVVIVPDQDEAGEKYLRSVVASLTGHAASIKVMRAKVGKDAADHIAAGHGLDELIEGTVPDLDDDEEARLAYERAVAREAHTLRVREDAARIVRQERASALEPPSFVRLGAFLAVPDEDVAYRIERLWPVGGRIVCAAQYKAGKTTLRDNLARALADAEPFLGEFAVTPPAGRVAIIDNELDERMVRRWLREQGIVRTDRITVLSLRGKVSSFDLLDATTRSGWAAKLKAEDVSVVLFDCLRPVLDALGLSEDKDSGRFLVAFDALLAEAGASEGVVVHHMGHAGERSRGDTRLRDWPDVEWKLVRDKDDQGQQDGDSRRVYFSAFGRDVDSPEGLLTYEPSRRRLTLAGGNRRQTAADAVIPDVLAYLGDNVGASQRAIETALGSTHKRADVRTAIRRACDQKLVDTADGPRRAVLHFLTTKDEKDDASRGECASAPSAPEVRQRTQSECASAPLGGALHSHTQEGSVRPGALLACDCGAEPDGEHWDYCHAAEQKAAS